MTLGRVGRRWVRSFLVSALLVCGLGGAATLGLAGEPAIRAVVVSSRVTEPAARYAPLGNASSARVHATETPEPSHLDRASGGAAPVTSDPDLAPPALAGVTGSSPGASPGSSLSVSFDGPDFDTSSLYNPEGGGVHYFVPPDPSGAAGTQSLVGVVNSVIEFRTKDGTRTFIASLRSFFAALEPNGFPFGSKVIYDAFTARFVVVSLDKTDTSAGAQANTSRLLVAVSDDGDPSGTWYMTAIDAVTQVAGIDRWADAIGLAAGEEAFYVTANLFQFGTCTAPCVSYGGSQLWVIAKQPLLGGGAASVAKLDPYAHLPSNATTTQPAMMTQPGPGKTDTYLTSYGPFTDGTNEFVQTLRLDDPLGTPTFTPTLISVGNIDDTAVSLPDAPQLGTGYLVDTGDRRTTSAAWSANSLWTTFTVVPPSGPDAGQATAYWVRLDGGAVVGSKGKLGGESLAPGTWTWRPSVAVNRSNAAFFGFAASGPNLHPGAYWATQIGLGLVVDDTSPQRAGDDWYVRTLGNPDQDRNRWGSYSSVAIDPTDQSGWFFNEYAAARGTPTQIPPYAAEDGRWATSWARAPEPLFLDTYSGTIRTGGGVQLRGSGFTAASVVLMYVPTANGVVSNGPFVPTSFTPNLITWPAPSSVVLGNGFSSVVVVNTDQGYRTSNTICQNLAGPGNGKPPSIVSVNGVGFGSGGGDCSIPTAYANTVLTPGAAYPVGLQNASQPQVNLFTASGNLGPLPMTSAGFNTWQFTVPSNAPSGPGSLQAVSSPYTGNVQSNAVSVILGARIGLTFVIQNGNTISVIGTGFSKLTAINFFNQQGNGVVNLGGLDGAGKARIPLTDVTSTTFKFQKPPGAAPGPSYVQALNPPFIPITSTGNVINGAFVLQ